ncbi:MAG: hypothetical protein VR65_27490 [Desulfobulbaceae bacterium BRH_c16a]|nr:MAG: hypothetical protein VR65_27490 [Desulfobulbaceae bacterium BRH_c16a]
MAGSLAEPRKEGYLFFPQSLIESIIHVHCRCLRRTETELLVKAACNHAHHLPERFRMMQDWADFLNKSKIQKNEHLEKAI